jgi:hypothetical protein
VRIIHSIRHVAYRNLRRNFPWDIEIRPGHKRKTNMDTAPFPSPREVMQGCPALDIIRSVGQKKKRR